MPEWLSVHLHFDADVYSEIADGVLLNVVRPFVQECSADCLIRGFFFVRYGVGGGHIRLRILPIDTGVRAAALSRLASRLSTSVQLGRVNDECKSFGVTHAVIVPYLAETDRYGGIQAMNIAETFFHASSTYAIKMLPKLNVSLSRRLGCALVAATTTVHAFMPDAVPACRFFDRYSGGYLQMTNEGRGPNTLKLFEDGYNSQSTVLAEAVLAVRDQLEAGTLSGPLREYYEACMHACSRLRALVAEGLISVYDVTRLTWEGAASALAPSYLHMTTNRLGVSIPHEAYLAHLIAASLRTRVAV